MEKFLSRFSDIERYTAYVLFAAAILLLLYRLFQHGTLFTTSRREKQKLRRDAEIHASLLCPDYDSRELKLSQKSYVRPDCTQVDPANEALMHKFAAVRESVFSAVDRFANDEAKQHLLLLADSGMGKTTFCLNYFLYRRGRGHQVALISLANTSALAQIAAIPSKRNTFLILDALDEDRAAIKDGVSRLSKLMDAASNFMTVLVTCRSQFFEDDASVPTQTGLARIVPRKAGEKSTYDFSRLYLAPFTEQQIVQFLRSKFPWWSILGLLRRQRAFKLVSQIPDLSVRPMLLALVPELVKEPRAPTEVYELYEYMIDRWLEREERWVDKATLESVSAGMAVFLFERQFTLESDRISPQELQEQVAVDISSLEWSHLTTRSLLNRDSEGRLKFAHRTVREFLVVRDALRGNNRPFNAPWTDFMRELIVSFAHTPGFRSENGRKAVERLLQPSSDAKRKFPLAEPLPEPGQRTRAELLSYVRGEKQVVARRRIFPAPWRNLTIKVERGDGIIYLRDLEYGLLWRIVDIESPEVKEQFNIYRGTLSEISKHRLSGEYRLPSFAEFLSLVRVQNTLPELPLINKHDSYWIADKFERASYLIASLSRVVEGGGTEVLIKDVDIPATGMRINLTAINPYEDRGLYNNLRALELYVKC